LSILLQESLGVKLLQNRHFVKQLFELAILVLGTIKLHDHYLRQLLDVGCQVGANPLLTNCVFKVVDLCALIILPRAVHVIVVAHVEELAEG
jgi:hypothetical protein